MTDLQKTRKTYRQTANAYAAAEFAWGQLAWHIEQFIPLIRHGRVLPDIDCGPRFDPAVFQIGYFSAIGRNMRRMPLGSVAGGLWVRAARQHRVRAYRPQGATST